MLNLVLAWGRLDGLLGALLGYARGLPLHVAAEEIGKMPGSQKLRELYKLLRETDGAGNVASLIKNYKKTYEKHSQIRRLIAHSNCVGISKENPDHVCFLLFDKIGEKNTAFESISISQIQAATTWGNEFGSSILDAINEIQRDVEKNSTKQ